MTAENKGEVVGAILTEVQTVTGSVYEINEKDQLIRRRSGTREPTVYQGPDEQWRSFVGIEFIDNEMLIIWSKDKGMTKCTRTSKVKKIVLEVLDDA
jgi:hypothetical protein